MKDDFVFTEEEMRTIIRFSYYLSESLTWEGHEEVIFNIGRLTGKLFRELEERKNGK